MKRVLFYFFLFIVIVMGNSQWVCAEDDIVTQADIDEGLAFCQEYPVLLNVNGASVISDVAPVIIKERTMIPARAVFENLGATVEWEESARLVTISLGSSTVKLTIDSKTAFVNGVQVPMEVPALIVNERTVIPVRFVAESLKCQVGWEDDTRTVFIQSDTGLKKTKISSITVNETDVSYQVVIEGDGSIGTYKSFAYEEPERFGIDIDGSELIVSSSSITVNQAMMVNVRYAQFDQDTVRIVVDLKGKIAGRVSYSEDKKIIYMDFNKDQVENYENLGDVTADGFDVVDWRATGMLVVIDPGHGGIDTGSQAIQNGTTILNEKDVNLDVALRLNRMLQEAGVNTYMLRDGDDSISLLNRPALANQANGSLYVSVHNNSSENASASGTETYYYEKSSENNYGISSKHLAELIQEEMVANLGLNNRGAKSQPAYAVLNKTDMPAVIIEGAFLSNSNNLALMLTDEFREQYARAAAKSIIQVLNESVEE